MLEQISPYKELCEKAEKVLDSMYSASLPRDMHARDLVNKHLAFYSNNCDSFGRRKKRPGRAMTTPPHPQAKKRKYLHHARTNVLYSGIHVHCMTCRKPPRGYHGCRMNKPSGSCSCTSPVFLMASNDEEDESNKTQWKVQRIINKKTAALGDGSGNSRKRLHVDMAPKKDGEVIVWEVKRPKLEKLPFPQKSEDFHDKNWFLSRISEAMADPVVEEYDQSNAFQLDPKCAAVRKEYYKITVEGSQTDDSLFLALYRHASKLKGGLGNSVGRKKYVKEFKEGILDHFRNNSSNPCISGEGPGRSWMDLAKSRMESERWEVDICSETNYTAQLSKNRRQGGQVEMEAYADKYNVNVVLYEDDKARQGFAKRSVHIKKAGSGDEFVLIYKGADGRYGTIETNLDIQQLHRDIKKEVQQLMAELSGLTIHDLRDLYTHVSSKLVERNGYVADFNPLLTALMGCNTNSLFLGSQGK